MTIRPCRQIDFEAIFTIVNDAAEAYRGVIPAGLLEGPLHVARRAAARDQRCGSFLGLRGGLGAGRRHGHPRRHGRDAHPARLRPHRQAEPGHRREAAGGVAGHTARPVLVGTWAAAEWAIRFYQRHGFQMVSPAEKDRLLRKYWSIPDRQIETSVVLADEQWRSLPGHGAARPVG